MLRSSIFSKPVNLPVAVPAYRRISLKSLTKVFVAAELGDISITLIGLLTLPALYESNPIHHFGWPLTILLKIAAMLLVAFILERVPRWPKIVWIVPIVAWLPFFWNLLVIMVEFTA